MNPGAEPFMELARVALQYTGHDHVIRNLEEVIRALEYERDSVEVFAWPSWYGRCPVGPRRGYGSCLL